jgi:putative heme transporter
MTANLLPFFQGGVGSVDAGMIAAFLAFGLPSSTVFVAVLTYRVIAFWLPIPPGIVAYLQLRRTVSRWRAQKAPARA